MSKGKAEQIIKPLYAKQFFEKAPELHYSKFIPTVNPFLFGAVATVIAYVSGSLLPVVLIGYPLWRALSISFQVFAKIKHGICSLKNRFSQQW
jgi:hypothetical protein